MKHLQHHKKVENSESKVSCIIAFVMISLKIRKSPLKIQTANCCLLFIVDTLLFWNSHWGFLTSLFPLLNRSYYRSLRLDFFILYIPLMVNSISLFRWINSIWGMGCGKTGGNQDLGNCIRYEYEILTRCWHL